MEGELIIVSFISSIFFLVGIQLLNHNWFKKETFKVNRDFDRQSNKLKLKKLEHELGLEVTKAKTGSGGLDLGGLLKTFGGLDEGTQGALIDRFLGGGEEGEERPAWMEYLGPVIEGFMKSEKGQEFLANLTRGGKSGEAGPTGPGPQV